MKGGRRRQQTTIENFETINHEILGRLSTFARVPSVLGRRIPSTEKVDPVGFPPSEKKKKTKRKNKKEEEEESQDT